MKHSIKTTYTDGEFRQLIRDEVKAMLNNEPSLVGASEEEGFINIQQAAEFLKVAKQTLYDKTSKGLIPFTKNGKRVLFKKSELKGWLNNQKK